MAASELLEWFQSQDGRLHPDVTIAEDPENGLHFRARMDVPPGDICTCPTNLSISILNVLKSNSLASKLVNHRDKNITIQTISYVFLAEQRLHASRSFWSPYIESLPKEDTLMLPIYYNDDDMKWLEGTNLSRAVGERLQQWREDWHKACDVLERQGIHDAKITWYARSNPMLQYANLIT